MTSRNLKVKVATTIDLRLNISKTGQASARVSVNDSTRIENRTVQVECSRDLSRDLERSWSRPETFEA